MPKTETVRIPSEWYEKVILYRQEHDCTLAEAAREVLCTRDAVEKLQNDIKRLESELKSVKKANANHSHKEKANASHSHKKYVTNKQLNRVKDEVIDGINEDRDDIKKVWSKVNALEQELRRDLKAHKHKGLSGEVVIGK